jgi:hypothetical protein
MRILVRGTTTWMEHSSGRGLGFAAAARRLFGRFWGTKFLQEIFGNPAKLMQCKIAERLHPHESQSFICAASAHAPSEERAGADDRFQHVQPRASARGRTGGTTFYVGYATFKRAESGLMGLSQAARTLGSLFGSFGKTLIVLGDPQHRFLGVRIIHLLRDGARLFCALPPVLGVIDEGHRHVSTIVNFSKPARPSTADVLSRAASLRRAKFTFAAAPASPRPRLPICLRAWRAPPRATCGQRCAPPLEGRNRRRDRRGW